MTSITLQLPRLPLPPRKLRNKHAQISRTENGKRKTENGIEADTAWNNPVTVIIKPDEGLTRAQKPIIQMDFGMVDGQLEIPSCARMAFTIVPSLAAYAVPSEASRSLALQLLLPIGYY